LGWTNQENASGGLRGPLDVLTPLLPTSQSSVRKQLFF
jgi:hypothetical protein